MADEKKGPSRRPSPLKRDMQSEKRHLQNRAFKAEVSTAVRRLKSLIGEGKADEAKLQLSEVYSLMDKGVKKGVFKANKASRTKSRITQQSSI